MLLFENKILEYKKQEIEQIEKSSIFEIQGFSPFMFRNEGIKVDIDKIYEIWKFLDSMHTSGYKNNVKLGLKDKITLEEINLVKYCLRKSLDLLNKTNSEKIFIPINSISRALISYRFITKQVDKNEKIIEWGPGSGFLGLMLLKSGYNYSAMDVAMGFYILQDILWSEEIKKKDFKHYKWWEWIKEKDNIYENIIATHMLAEMHPEALKFNLRRNAKTKKKIKYFFEDFGLSNSHEKVGRIFCKFGNYLNYYVNIKEKNFILYYGVFSNCKIRKLNLKHYIPNLGLFYKFSELKKLIFKILKNEEYETIFNPYFHKRNIVSNRYHGNEKNLHYEKDSALNIINDVIEKEYKNISLKSPDCLFLNG